MGLQIIVQSLKPVVSPLGPEARNPSPSWDVRGEDTSCEVSGHLVVMETVLRKIFAILFQLAHVCQELLFYMKYGHLNKYGGQLLFISEPKVFPSRAALIANIVVFLLPYLRFVIARILVNFSCLSNEISFLFHE